MWFVLIKDLVCKLCSAPGVSGNESNVSHVIKNELCKFGETFIDKNGNVFLNLVNKKENKKTLMLDAHMDQVGFVVTAVQERGFVKIVSCGGIDPRVMKGTSVVIHGKEDVLGTVCLTAPHLKEKNKDESVKEVVDLDVDTGLSSDKAKNLISLGDVVTFKEEPSVLLNNRISSPGIDNRASVAVLIKAVELIDAFKDSIDFNIVVAFTVQEETTGKGAITSSYQIDPDEAIVVDTSFAKQPGISNYKTGTMSGGPMIGISPSLDRKMFEELKKFANKSDIPYQVEVMGGKTGTNADHISVSRAGVRTALISVPIKYMHTPVEVVDVRDIEYSAELIKMYVLEKFSN